MNAKQNKHLACEPTMCDHLEPLSWRPGQSQERWERPAPGLAEAELDELELELEEEVEGLEEVDLVVELYEETMEFLGDEVCEGRGAGSESEPDEEDIVRSFP